jgi:transcriptional regulator with XRE-family HTH domain
MSHPEIEKLISKLQTWCQEKRGRNTEIAKMLGVSRQLVSDWFSRKTDPLADKLFVIRDFLRKQRRQSERKRKS